MTATEKRLLKNLSWRATLKPYTAPGVSTRPMKKPKPTSVSPGSAQRPGSGNRQNTQAPILSARWAGIKDRLPAAARSSILSPGLKSDILSGKTGSESRNLPRHRISCSLHAEKRAYRPLFAACWTIIPHPRGKCKSFFGIFANFFRVISVLCTSERRRHKMWGFQVRTPQNMPAPSPAVGHILKYQRRIWVTLVTTPPFTIST